MRLRRADLEIETMMEAFSAHMSCMINVITITFTIYVWYIRSNFVLFTLALSFFSFHWRQCVLSRRHNYCLSPSTGVDVPFE